MTLRDIVVGTVKELSEYFIILIASASVIVFLWGIVKYIARGDSDEARKTGRTFMMWGIIGFVVMFGVWGLVAILQNTFGVTTTIPQF